MTDRLPTSKSYGGDNTWVVPCDVYNGRRHYAVCLRIIQRKEENNPHTWEPDCNRAIACLECPALEMRDKEEDAGYALYYEPRDESRFAPMKNDPDLIFSKSYQRGWGSIDKVQRNQTAPESQAKPAEKSKPKRKPKSTGSMHADLVNKLMEEETKNAKRSKGRGTDTDSA